MVVQNRRVRFEFDVRRNITIVRGDSATGKTTLMTLLDAYDRLGDESGVEVICPRRCVTLTNANWEAVVQATSSSIVFLDEDVRAAKTPEFARLVQQSDNYYVIVTREDLPNLPYSVDEIYGIHVSGKYADLRRTYNSFYRLYDAQAKRYLEQALEGTKRKARASGSRLRPGASLSCRRLNRAIRVRPRPPLLTRST